jgi:hypothetical protein
MSVNKLTFLLQLRVFLSFLQIIRGFDYPGKYISQPTLIIGGLLYRANTKVLYTFKMIQKTNATYLELHTYTSR